MEKPNEEKLEEISDFFNKRSEVYDIKHLENVDGGRESKSLIASYLPPDTQTVIDFGIGTGLELEAIYRRFPHIKIIGLDIAENMLEQLMKKYPDKSIDLRCADYLDYDFGACLYDAALSVMSFHHYDHDLKLDLYRRINKCLRPNGIYVECDYMLSEQEYEDAQEKEDFFFAEYERIKREQGLISGHTYHYDTPLTVANQISLLRGAGFKSVKEVWRNGNTVILVADK